MPKFDVVIVCTTSSIDYAKFSSVFIGTETGCLDIINKQLLLQYAIGDFDHVNNGELEIIKMRARTFIKYPDNKDYIDGECAVVMARKEGYSSILYIADGTDLDFIIGSFGLVKKYDITIMNQTSFAYLLKPGVNSLTPPEGFHYLSLIPITNSEVTIKGFDYRSENLKLKSLDTKALRNTFRHPRVEGGEPFEVKILSGQVIII